MVGTQDRTLRVAKSVLSDGADGPDTRITESSKRTLDSHPRYREAKKAGLDFDVTLLRTIDFSPKVDEVEYYDLLNCPDAYRILAAVSPRAPPFTA